MKYSKIISLFLLFLSLFACTKEVEKPVDEVQIENAVIEENKTSRKDLSFDKSFSISFWIKPRTNYYDTAILELQDSDESIKLVNNSEDENHLSTGLSLVHQNGSLYQDSSFYLESYNYNHVVISFMENIFFLYLNGENVGEKVFSDGFEINDFSLILNSDDIEELIVDDDFKDVKTVQKEYLAKFDKRLYNIDYADGFKNNAKGKVCLPYTNLDVFYECGPHMKIEKGYLIFDKNDSEKDINTSLKVYYEEYDKNICKEIKFVIRGNNEQNKVDEVINIIDNQLQYVISESHTFKNEINDCLVDYEVLEGEAIFKDGHFIKTVDKEKAQLKIKASVKSRGQENEITKDVILLDEYNAYLLVYFDGNDGWPDHITGNENIYFALSDNLYNWRKIDSKGLLNCEKGSGRFRDPYIARSKDGNFIITTTEGYNNPGMYVSETDDLINFETKHLSFNSVDHSISLSGNETWAPEFVYNQEKDVYSIIFSDPSIDNKGIYAVDTKDFRDVSYPYIYFNAGYNVIDANVTMLDNQWYMLYKNEDDGKLHYAISKDINNPTWTIYDEGVINEGYAAEGPFMLNDHINNRFIFYCDSYKESLIYSSNIYKWTDTIDIYPNIDEGVSNLGGVRHFSIIELTEKEVERLVNYYE